jgi:hypothetical protein
MLATAADVRDDGRGRGCHGSSGGDSQCDPPKSKRPVEEQPQSEQHEGDGGGEHHARRGTDPDPGQLWSLARAAVSMGYDLSTRCRQVSCSRPVGLRSKVSPTALRFARRAAGATGCGEFENPYAASSMAKMAVSG